MVHRAGMKEKTKVRWAGLVEEWKRSGKTAAQFAEGKPFSAGTLTWRACQLRQAEAADVKQSAESRPGKRGAKVVLAEVVRRRVPAPLPAVSGLSLEVAGVRISVAPDFDEALLRRVVLVVREVQP